MTSERRVRVFRGIRWRLAALVLISVAPLVGVVAWQASNVRHNGREDARIDTLRLSRLAAEGITSKIAETTAVLRVADQLSANSFSPGVCAATLATGVVSAPSAVSAVMIAPDGSVPCSFAVVDDDISLADRAYVRDAFRAGAPSAGLESPGALAPMATLVVTQPVLDGALLVALAIDLGPDLDGFVEEFALPDGSVVLVMDGAGRVISQWPELVEPLGGVIAAKQLAAQVTAGGVEGMSEEAGSDGVRRAYSYVDVAGSGESVFAVVGIPTSAAFASANDDLRTYLIAAAIVTLVAIVLAGVISEMAVRRHLRAIGATVRRIGAGDLGARTGDRRAASELAEVAAAIDDMAADLQAREASLGAIRAERARLLDELLTVQEDERRRIAADIHDDTIQTIIGSMMSIQLLRRDLADAAAVRLATEAELRMSAAVDRLRRLIFELEPAVASDDLEAGLEQYLSSAIEPHRADVRVHAEGEFILDGPSRQVLERNLREAALNAVRHGGATTVDVRIDGGDGVVTATVTDDGAGLPGARPDRVGHHGLRTMRERAEALGGAFHIGPAAGGGTRVWFSMPAVSTPSADGELAISAGRTTEP